MNIIKRCRHGMMIVNLKDRFQGRSLECYGEYAEKRNEMFGRFLQKGSLALDIGASIGSVSLALVKYVGKEGGVLAFEPERHNYYTLCGNVAMNGLSNVYCISQAVGEDSRTAMVPEVDQNVIQNYGGMSLRSHYPEAATYPIQMISLDSMGLKKCDFMKVDVVGLEAEVIEGAKEVIAKHRPVICLDDGEDENAAKLTSKLESADYNLFRYTFPLYAADNYYGAQENVFQGVALKGILACPKDRKFNLEGLPLS
jgi:FkbM family methyltransferase